MIKKLSPVFLLVTISMLALYSCKKTSISTTDATKNYFPLIMGTSITYAVDSVYYLGTPGVQTEVKSQMKYSITDTFTDSKHRPSYMLTVFKRPYDGAVWVAAATITVTPDGDSLLYAQDGVQYVKLVFPVANGVTWPGNEYAPTADSPWAYLANWNYTYANYHSSYFDGYQNFDNTVTVLEDNEHVNYQSVDSAVAGYDTYAEEVYAYNVGMVYKNWYHTTWVDSSQNKSGYSVVMQAIDQD